MNVVAAVVANIGGCRFCAVAACRSVRRGRAEPGATTGLDVGRGDFAREKGGVLLPELRNQGEASFSGAANRMRRDFASAASAG